QFDWPTRSDIHNLVPKHLLAVDPRKDISAVEWSSVSRRPGTSRVT
ncbi:hypothetical protein LINPERHAP2_LOCUS24551, partial [Linum perenne]